MSFQTKLALLVLADLILAFAVGWFLWRRTSQWPLRLRLVPRTLLLAVSIAPASLRTPFTVLPAGVVLLIGNKEEIYGASIDLLIGWSVFYIFALVYSLVGRTLRERHTNGH
ncbi:MAG: hypothetical protein EOP84_08520 [Verrucomicrobiaceae bacterium]|nr:MAG: hypothetical protein EOP84_08520 [Verrucomicrobiaceae bacterium]